MTQEQKARAYDKALEKARARYDKEPTDGYVGYANQILKELFPQLVESEDERIRKEMVDYFSQYKDDGIRGVDITPWIAYLERQGNPERYGLCRPVEWSDEDEDFINMLILHFNYLIDKGGDSVETYKSYREKLKSFSPQSEQEWSEKEKKMLAVISYKISQHQGNDERSLFTPDEAEFICGMEDKLKSIKPSWKPSEEQMEVLRRALHINPASGKLHYLKENEVCILQGLLKQLEKL